MNFPYPQLASLHEGAMGRTVRSSPTSSLVILACEQIGRNSHVIVSRTTLNIATPSRHAHLSTATRAASRLISLRGCPSLDRAQRKTISHVNHMNLHEVCASLSPAPGSLY